MLAVLFVWFAPRAPSIINSIQFLDHYRKLRRDTHSEWGESVKSKVTEQVGKSRSNLTLPWRDDATEGVCVLDSLCHFLNWRLSGLNWRSSRVENQSVNNIFMTGNFSGENKTISLFSVTSIRGRNRSHWETHQISFLSGQFHSDQQETDSEIANKHSFSFPCDQWRRILCTRLLWMWLRLSKTGNEARNLEFRGWFSRLTRGQSVCRWKNYYVCSGN